MSYMYRQKINKLVDFMNTHHVKNDLENTIH